MYEPLQHSATLQGFICLPEFVAKKMRNCTLVIPATYVFPHILMSPLGIRNAIEELIVTLPYIYVLHMIACAPVHLFTSQCCWMISLLMCVSCLKNYTVIHATLPNFYNYSKQGTYCTGGGGLYKMLT